MLDHQHLEEGQITFQIGLLSNFYTQLVWRIREKAQDCDGSLVHTAAVNLEVPDASSSSPWTRTTVVAHELHVRIPQKRAKRFAKLIARMQDHLPVLFCERINSTQFPLPPSKESTPVEIEQRVQLIKSALTDCR